MRPQAATPRPGDWQPNPGPQATFLATRASEVLYGGAAGGGKMLALDTPVPTPTGWTTMRDIEAGAVVFGRDGLPIRVLAAYLVDLAPESYRITFDDGASLVACADHEWLTFDDSELSALTRRDPSWRAARRMSRPRRVGGKKSPLFTATIAARNAVRPPPSRMPPTGTVRTTAGIAATLLTARGRRNHAVPIAAPLELPALPLLLDPYVLGVWLGDGDSSGGRFTSADQEIADAVTASGFNAHRVHGSYAWGTNGLCAKLRQLGLIGNKHIPAQYLRAAHEQRLALLRGLMDTDGHACESGSVEFTNTNRVLAEQTLELILSLGHKAAMKEGRAKLNGRDCGPKYRIKWTPPDRVFRLSRKRARQKLQGLRRTGRFRYVVSCERVPPVPMRCIKVDAQDGLFLAGREMVPTHNSAAIVALPLRWTHHPKFRALVLRRETTDLGNLLDQAAALYPRAIRGATPKQTGAGVIWRFPSGATVWFNHCQHEKDAAGYDGYEFQLIEFDELTHFEEKQYRHLRARIRSSSPGLPRYTRSTSNPGNVGHEWVMRRWGPWLDPTYAAHGMAPRVVDGRQLPPIPPGQVLHYLPMRDGEPKWVPRGTPEALSRVFIPARLADNPHLLANDPGYARSLMDLDQVRSAQLLDGDWLIRPAAGLYFKRGWFAGKFLDERPIDVAARVRYWDLAASTTGDYAVGALMSRLHDGRFVLEHLERLRGEPGDIRRAVHVTAEIDGHEIPVVIEQDPGQAGKDQVASYVTMMAGWTIEGRPKRVDKIVAAGPLSSQAKVGNLLIVHGEWNDTFFLEAEAFPEGTHDDQVDACSGALAVLLSRAETGADLLRRIYR